MANAIEHRAAGFSLAALAHNLVEAAKSAYARQMAYTQTYNELSSLTDRELEDIGILRSMIPSIARTEADTY